MNKRGERRLMCVKSVRIRTEPAGANDGVTKEEEEGRRQREWRGVWGRKKRRRRTLVFPLITSYDSTRGVGKRGGAGQPHRKFGCGGKHQR